MPETRKAKRSFESQAFSSLEGVQISPISRVSNPSSTEAVELITRLIDYIKII